MRLTILGSGSGGNAAVIECGNTRLLVDAGLSAKQINQRLDAVGITPESLHGILLTHEHGDHTRGLRVFLKKLPALPIVTTPQTAYILRQSGIEHTAWKLFESGQTFPLHDIEVQSFAIQHDAVDPVGFVFASSSRRLGFLSDTGHITTSLPHLLSNLHALFIEANYDDNLLDADTKRPFSIKQRIASRHGHLSNTQVASFVGEIAHPGMQHIILGHLSSDCNCPDVATQHIHTHLTHAGHPHIRILCANQHTPTAWLEV